MRRPYALPVPTESAEQIAVFDWAAYSIGAYPELSMMYHVGNERKCSPQQGAMLKRSGVRPGVPDIVLPVARGGHHGLYVELKRVRGGRLSEEQRSWIARLNAEGYYAVCCEGAEVAIEVIVWYLSLYKLE